MKLTLALLISTALLAGCATGQIETVVSGPKLRYPPPAIVDAFEVAARQDEQAAEWVIDLDRFYQKQELAEQSAPAGK